MTNVHPYWDSDEGAVTTPASVSAATETSKKVAIVPASRMPAAIVGIVLIASVGITVMGGWDAVRGQLAGSSSSTTSKTSSSAEVLLEPVTVTITPAGLTPKRINVVPGQTIVWKNTTDTPHILASATLRNDSGAYLYTPAIFPGGEVRFTVGKNETTRNHEYGSNAGALFTGTISVTGQAVGEKKQPLGSLNDIPLPSGQGKSASTAKSSVKSAVSSSVSSSTVTTEGSATTAGETGGSIHEATNVVPVMEEVVNDNNLPMVDMMDIAPQSPDVMMQPETGPREWVAVALSLCTLLIVTRRMLVRVKGTKMM